MNKKRLIQNVVSGFGGQMISLILGMIVPRMMITAYGSDVNGLLSTVGQIFIYMALLEAGIGQAAKNALFKPIAEKNLREISYIASVARRYYRKFTVYYGIGVLILSSFVPFLLKSEVDKLTIFGIVLLEGMSGVCSFYFIQTPSAILNADGREYINNGINLTNKIISYLLKIILAFYGMNIILLEIVTFLVTVCKVIVYQIYFRRQYDWIDYQAAPANAVLKDRNSFIITEIAWTIFSSTDMIVLSAFLSTQMSSVYSVYNLVFNSLNLLLTAVYSSISYILGRTFHENRIKYMGIHDMFNSVFVGGMTIALSVAYIMIVPFIKLYTRGVTDVNYIYSSIPVMFCLVQLFSWSRYVAGNLTSIAGYARQVSRISMLEAITNIVFSILLVQKFGIVGVLAATVLALPLKVIYCTYLAEKKILKRSCKKTICILGCNYLSFFLVVLLSDFWKFQINTYYQFMIYGMFLTLIVSIAIIGVNMLVNPECRKFVSIIRK